MKHREKVNKVLSGNGIEIGALHNPLPIDNAKCRVEYLDVEPVDTLENKFSELAAGSIKKPDYIGNIERQDLPEITGKTFDFVILNHVLEHVANPIKVIENIWKGLNANGKFILSIPDKRFTFDKNRPLTSYEHILTDYYKNVSEVNDDHYVDFLAHVHPEVFKSKTETIQAINNVRERLEHAHVWDSTSFREHLFKIIPLLGINAHFLFESGGDDNKHEYFVILQKESKPFISNSEQGEQESGISFQPLGDNMPSSFCSKSKALMVIDTINGNSLSGESSFQVRKSENAEIRGWCYNLTSDNTFEEVYLIIRKESFFDTYPFNKFTFLKNSINKDSFFIPVNYGKEREDVATCYDNKRMLNTGFECKAIFRYVPVGNYQLFLAGINNENTILQTVGTSVICSE
ncbi:MAG: methyltransferase domain-containing protein [Nitrospinae bacterium]|nr:methyltransferase domain-containing protein [Nitrospinota bacterium]